MDLESNQEYFDRERKELILKIKNPNYSADIEENIEKLEIMTKFYNAIEYLKTNHKEQLERKLNKDLK